MELTKEEIKRRELHSEILKMAKDKFRFNVKDDAYYIPEGFENEDGYIDKEKKNAVLTQRYEEEEEVKTEQEQWEEEQVCNLI
jgi:pre-mRNA-splicing factor ATP-dependent RNA helicase DHX16